MPVKIARKNKNASENESLNINSLKQTLVKNIKIAYKIIDFTSQFQDKNLENITEDQMATMSAEIKLCIELFGKKSKNTSLVDVLISATKLIQETNKVAKSLNIDIYQINEENVEIISDDDLEIITTLVEEYGIEKFEKMRKIEQEKREKQEESEIKIIETENFIMSG